MSQQRSRSHVLAVASALLFGLVVPSVAVAAPPAANSASSADATHPVVMQQAFQADQGRSLAGYTRATTLAPRSAQPAAPPPANGGPLREVFAFSYAGSLDDTVNNPPTFGYRLWDFSVISTVGYFGLGVLDTGSLDHTTTGWKVMQTSQFQQFVTAAHNKGTRVVLTIVLQDFGSGTPHMCNGLANQQTTVNETIAAVIASGADGVNVDYEGYGGVCSAGRPQDLLVSLVAKLRAGLPAGRNYLSIDTYGGSAADHSGLGFFLITQLNAYVDAFFVMSYDMEYSNWRAAGCTGFCLGPTSPLTGYSYNDTGEMADYTATVPASKVILGVPYYGRKACVSAPGPNAKPIQKPNFPNEDWVDADRYVDAIYDAFQQPNVVTHHLDANDPTGAEPWETWHSNLYGCDRELYWDNTTSLGLKYDLVNRDQLRGVGLWTVNYGETQELWDTLKTHFTNLPGPPSNVIADGVDSGANLSWQPPTVNNGGPISAYWVTVSPGGQVIQAAPGPHLNAHIGGLSNGTTYTFQVAASNSAGPGPLSPPSNAVTPSAGPRHRSYFAEGTTQAGFQEYLSIENLAGPTVATVTFLFGDGTAAFSIEQPLPGSQRTTLDVNAIVGPGHDVSVIVDTAAGNLVVERPVYFRACPSGLCIDGGHVGVGLAPRNAWYFAEGFTGAGFHEYLTLLNPSGADTTAAISYQFRSGPAVPDQGITVKAFSRATIDVNAYVGTGRDVSAVVTGAAPIVVERPMYFSACLDGVCMNGGDVVGGTAPQSVMSFAEGSTRAGIVEYLTLANTGGTDVKASVNYQFGPGQGAAQTIAYPIPAHSRQTIFVNNEVGAGKDVSMTVTAAGGQLVAERPQYFNFCLPMCVNGGHVAAGATASPSWYFAEGFTGSGFREYLTLDNPGLTTALVHITYLAGDGIPIPLQNFALLAQSRVTVDVGDVVGANRSVAAAIASDQPVIAERPLYFNACLGAICIDGGSDAVGIPAPL